METKTNMGAAEVAKMGTNVKPQMEGVHIELAQGISVEEMKAMFFNNAVLREPDYSLRQLNSRGKRYYYVFNDGEPIFYPSVTTILHNVMPENKVLTDWKISMGKEKADAIAMEKARYGSFLHGQIAEMIIGGRYDLDFLGEKLKTYAEKNNLPSSFVDMYEDEAKADLVAIAKWVRDYEVQPIAIEVSLYSPTYGYAGTIDCVCTMREFSKDDSRKKAQSDNRIFAIVDFKSGRKGFYDDYAVQLELYRMMWNETFPDCQIERTFNLAPKDWRGTVKKVPSYSFEEQTNNPEIECIPDYLSIFKRKFVEDRRFAICSGVIDLSKDTDNVQVFDLAELVKSHKKEEVVYESADPKTLFE